MSRFSIQPLRSASLRTLTAVALAATFAVAAPVTAHADSSTSFTMSDVSTYQSKIKNDGTNVYYPTNAVGELPVALVLQGGKVNRNFYSEYAAKVASYGFIVVTPNHKRLNFFDLDYYTSTSQVGETLTWMATENGMSSSPLHGRIDTDTMVLLGHSFGGATGLSIAEDKCSIPFCTTLTFNLPSAGEGRLVLRDQQRDLGYLPEHRQPDPGAARAGPVRWGG